VANQTVVPTANAVNNVIDPWISFTGFQFGQVQSFTPSNADQRGGMEVVQFTELFALSGQAGVGTVSSTASQSSGTEVVQRAMSAAELKATESTGLIRGGREGTHFVSDAVNSSAQRAQQRLALPVKPEVRATLEVPSGTFSTPSRVQPLPRPGGGTLPGGGMERTATGPVPAKVIRVKKY
jgi:hypothetical protein